MLNFIQKGQAAIYLVEATHVLVQFLSRYFLNKMLKQVYILVGCLYNK